MPGGIYNRQLYNSMTGLVDLRAPITGDQAKLALMGVGFTYDPKNNVWADILANEAAGAGYTVGGQDLVSQAVNEEPGAADLANWTADNVQWAGLTIDTIFGVLYFETVQSSALIGALDWGGTISITNTTLIIEWDAQGILIYVSA